MPLRASPFEFNPNLCCEHEWRDLPKEHNQYCTLCGATCVRDPDSGQILEYDRTSRYGQPRHDRDEDEETEEQPQPRRHRRRAA